MIKVLFWNCRGIANSPTLRALHHLASSKSPDVIFLSEPMTSSLPLFLQSSLGYDGFLSNNLSNNSLPTASIWCLFKLNSSLDITLSDASPKFLSISFRNPSNDSRCLLTIQRKDLWDYLLAQATTNLPWCAIGDFNSSLLRFRRA